MFGFGGEAGHVLGGGDADRGNYNRAPSPGGDDFDLSWLGNPACPLSVALLCGLGVLAMTSLGSVPPLHYGIRYNSYSKASDTSFIYTPGRYLIGPFNRFLLFPASVQTIEFTNEPRIAPSGIRYASLHTRTKEGLGLHLQVSLQYRLMEDSIGKLYSEFNQNYEQVFSSAVRDILIKAASEYRAADLWEERKKFGDIMQTMVNAELLKTYAECWGLQLINIDLPNEYEDSIVRSEVQKQNLFMRQQEQLSTEIKAETTVIQAEFQRRVKVILAEGRANYTVMTKQAMAEAQQMKIELESQVYGMLKATLNLTPDGLVQYSKYGAVEDLEGSSILYGFTGASQLLVKTGGSR